MTERDHYQEQLDTRALEMAGKALTKIEEHEKHSLVQHEQIIGAIGKLSASIDKLFDRFWIAAVAVIAILMAMVAFFVTDLVRGNSHVQVHQERTK